MLSVAKRFLSGQRIEPVPLWTNPYVTDGLVAMWDGEWNAGGGEHSDSPTEIADLVGTSPLALSGTVNIGTNYFSPVSSFGGISQNTTTTVFKNVVDANSSTIEICTGFNGYSAGEWFSVNDSTRLYNTDNSNPRWLRIKNSLSAVSGWSVPTDGSATIAIRVGGDGTAYFVNGEKKFTFTAGTSEMPAGIRIARNMNGTMLVHCVRISSALTDVQIAANYAIDKSRFNLP